MPVGRTTGFRPNTQLPETLPAAGEEREHVTVREREGIQEVHENATSKPPMRLVVHKQLKGDVYRDIVRITENYRRDSQDRLVPEGTVVKLIVSNGASRTVFVWLRGMKGVEGETEPWIRMDDKTRNDLGVDRGQKYDFRIERVNICGRLRWALGSSDPALRVAVQLGVVSVVLGVLGLVVAIVSISCR